MSDDTEELESRCLCAKCVGEAYLSAEIEKNGEEDECAYCGVFGPTFTLSDIADRISVAFEQHYTRTAENPDSFQYAMMKDREIDYDWEREGERTVYAIMNAAIIPEDAAQDLQEILAERYGDYEAAKLSEETEFDADAHYEEIMPSSREWLESWYAFETSIKTEARLFSRSGAAQLASIFAGIDKMATHNNEPIVVTAGPDTAITEFFRARVFQSDEALSHALHHPDAELGPPPSRYATAGRMNAKGISVFYGATDINLALAEVRPPVGSRVVVATFAVIRPLKLLNLNALKTAKELGSIFDPFYADRLARMGFFKVLSDRIARAVMPDDQDFDYLPTQAIADFLATESDLNIDGILFPSAQAGGGGLNVVLFRKASKVEALSIPKGTEIDVRTYSQDDDGYYPDYWIWWEVPPAKPEENQTPSKVPPFDFTFQFEMEPRDADFRDATLQINMKTLKVHIIEAVSYKTDENSVNHHTIVKTENPPL